MENFSTSLSQDTNNTEDLGNPCPSQATEHGEHKSNTRDPLVPVASHAKVKAWPKHEHGARAEYLPFSEALQQQWSTDAHFAAYSVPKIDRRLSKSALERDVTVPMVAMVFDVDCKEVHGTKVAAPDTWYDDLAEKLDCLERAHPGAYVSATRGGARIVYILDTPFEIRTEEDAARWTQHYVGCCDYLEKEFGIVADRACKDWTRLYRLPHATRDGNNDPENRPYQGDANQIGVWNYRPQLDPTPAPGSTRKSRSTPKNKVQTTAIVPAICRAALEQEGQGILWHLFKELCLLGPQIEPGMWAIICPFEHEHSSGQSFDTSTVLYTPEVPTDWGHIHCLHNACSGGSRPQAEYLTQFTAEEIAEAKAAANRADKRKPVQLGPDEHRVTDEVIDALGSDPDLYQRAHGLVRVIVSARPATTIGGDRCQILIEPASGAFIRDRITKHAKLCSMSEDGEVTESHPPQWLTPSIDARGQWNGIPELSAIVETPVLKPDGTILARPGYDPDTHLLYIPNGVYPEVPELPTIDDAIAAKDALLDLVVDFPFAEDCHRAAWLGGVLTPLARFAFAGPSPLLAIDGTTAGVGKGLLATIVGIVATGRAVPPMPPCENSAEERKRITSIAISGDRVVIIDNISGQIGSDALEAVLTTTHWRDRILGGQKIFNGDIGALWLVTGNNLKFTKQDLIRRTAYCRVKADDEHPELRGTFKYPHLVDHVSANQAALTVAALTMLRAYVVAGRPAMNLPTWGSYDGWSGLVRNTLVWLGLADPAEGQKELSLVTDTAAMGLGSLLRAWQRVCTLAKRSGLRAQEALDLVFNQQHPPGALAVACRELRQTILELVPGPSGQLPSAPRLGAKLRELRERVVDGAMMTYATVHGAGEWRVKPAPSAAGSRRGHDVPARGGHEGDGGHGSAPPQVITDSSVALQTDGKRVVETVLGNVHHLHRVHPIHVTGQDSVNLSACSDAEMDEFEVDGPDEFVEHVDDKIDLDVTPRAPAVVRPLKHYLQQMNGKGR